MIRKHAWVMAMAILWITSPASGEWIQFRGDRALTGHSSIVGSITSPVILKKHFIGANEHCLNLTVEDASSNASIACPTQPFAEQHIYAINSNWQLNGHYMNIEGETGKFFDMPYIDHKTGHLLGDAKTFQRVEFETLFTVPGIKVNDKLCAVGKMYDRVNGAWKERWTSPPIPTLYAANVINGDFDRDGKQEIALAPWYDLWVLDAASGICEATARYTPEGAESGRGYGWLGAHDLNQDGTSEFVVIGDFENHIDVLGWRDGKLQPFWRHLIERGTVGKKTVVRAGALPVQDIDGDGKPEIVVSLFNAAGDEKWHVCAFNGMSGDKILDLTGEYLSGMGDMDGDSAVELFLTRANGMLLPDQSSLRVCSWKSRQLNEIWKGENAAFQTALLSDFPLNVNSGTGSGRETVLLGDNPARSRRLFAVSRILSRENNQTEVAFWAVGRDQKTSRIASLRGSGLEALGLRERPDGSFVILVRGKADGGMESQPIASTGGRLKLLTARNVPAPLSIVLSADLDGSGSEAMIVQTACERIRAIRSGEKSGEVMWDIPARGIYTADVRQGGGAEYGGAILANLAGDGQKSVIAAQRSPLGCARLTAFDQQGREVWHHDFEQLPPAPPKWNIGGLTMWFAGKFTSPEREDVLVNFRRSTTQSDETWLLDGRTGAVIWKRGESIKSGDYLRACGGSWVAVYDHDGDGLDDILSAYPDVIYVMDGATGEILLGRSASAEVLPGSYYAMPMVMDFLGNGARQILYGACSYHLALLDMKADVIWKEGPSSGTPSLLPGIGDANGDGKLELMSPGHCTPPDDKKQEFHCYDAATGALRWKARMPGAGFGSTGTFNSGSPMVSATADVNQDGCDECLFAVNKVLFALGEDKQTGQGRIVWNIKLPARVGPVSIAPDQRGGMRLLAVCEDGFLYEIGAQ